MKVISIDKLQELAAILEDNKLIYDGDSPIYAIDLLVDIAEANAADLTLAKGGDFIHDNQ